MQASSVRSSTMLLWVLVWGHALKHVFSAGFLVILPELKSSLLLSNVQVGLLSTVRSASGSLANFPAGYVADRYSNRFVPALAAVMVLVGLALFALGGANELREAMIFAAVMMFGIAFWHPPAIGALSRVFPAKRGFAIGLHGTGGSVGEVLGPLLVGGLLVVMSWRLLLQVSLIPALLGGLSILVLLRSQSLTPGSASMASYLKAFTLMLRNPRLLAVLIIAAGFAGTQGTVMTFLPIYVREDLGQSTWVVGAYVSMSQLVGIGSQPLMGYLSDRIGRKRIIVPMLLGLGLTLLGLYLSATGVFFVLSLLATGAFLFSGLALVLAAASDVVGDETQATSVSLVFASTALFAGLGPFIGGIVADGFEVRAVFLFAAVLVSATGVFALLTKFESPRMV